MIQIFSRAARDAAHVEGPRPMSARYRDHDALTPPSAPVCDWQTRAKSRHLDGLKTGQVENAGGAGRSRTALAGFAIRCITDLLPRLSCIDPLPKSAQQAVE